VNGTMTSDPELPLRQLIKELIQAGQRLADELSRALEGCGAHTDTRPDRALSLWDEAVARSNRLK
jgi:hypothetical protein